MRCTSPSDSGYIQRIVRGIFLSRFTNPMIASSLQVKSDRHLDRVTIRKHIRAYLLRL